MLPQPPSDDPSPTIRRSYIASFSPKFVEFDSNTTVEDGLTVATQEAMRKPDTTNASTSLHRQAHLSDSHRQRQKHPTFETRPNLKGHRRRHKLSHTTKNRPNHLQLHIAHFQQVTANLRRRVEMADQSHPTVMGKQSSKSPWNIEKFMLCEKQIRSGLCFTSLRRTGKRQSSAALINTSVNPFEALAGAESTLTCPQKRRLASISMEN